MKPSQDDLGPRKKKRFAQTMLKALRDAGDTTKYTYDAKQFCLVGPNGQMLLRNQSIQYYRAAPYQRPQVVRQFLRAILNRSFTTIHEYEDLQPDLYPRICSRVSFEVERLRGDVLNRADREDAFVPFAEHLGIGLAYEMPESLAFVSRQQLAGWGRSFDAVFADARKNLAAITQEPLKKLGTGLWISPWNDSHESARLVLSEYIREHAVYGEHVVMVPNRDTLLVSGSEDVDGLTQMISVAENRQEPYFISGLLYRLQDDRWVPFMPDASHPSNRRFRSLAYKTFGGGYNAQKKVLDEKFKKRGRCSSPATSWWKAPAGNLRVVAHRVEGVKTALPVTDYVIFVSAHGFPTLSAVGPGSVGDLLKPWTRVREFLGHLMTTMNLYPERFMVQKFPSPEQLAAFGGHEPVG